MRYDVNFALLGLLLVVIVSMIGMVFYYNLTYSSLNDRYDFAMRDVENKTAALNKTLQEVNAKEVQLQTKERLLLDYINELNLSKERETSLGSHFTEVKGQNDLLDEQLNQTRNERNSYAQLYSKTKENYDVCQRNYDVKVSELNSANAKVNNIKGWLVEVSDKISAVGSTASTLQDDTQDIEGKANSIRNNGNTTSDIRGLAGDIRSISSDMRNDLSSIESAANTIKSIVDRIRGS